MGNAVGIAPEVVLDEGKLRLDFVREEFVPKCMIGNPNIALENVAFIDRTEFEQQETLRSFEEWQALQRLNHAPGCIARAADLSASDVVLFVSHRWQPSRPKDRSAAAHRQLSLIKHFLLTETGMAVTKVWMDYPCIPQDRSKRWSFRKRLDNVHTAIFLSHLFLALPSILDLKMSKTQERFWKSQNYLHGANKVKYALSAKCDLLHVMAVANKVQHVYSDLRDYTSRGWCQFEMVTALLARTQIFVTFVFGAIEDPMFYRFKDGTSFASDKRLTRTLLKDGFELGNVSSLKELVSQATEEVENKKGMLVPQQVREAWGLAIIEPMTLLKTLCSTIKSITDAEARKILAQTLELHSANGERISILLPHFTFEQDRVVVLNLLASFAAFCWGSFDSVASKREEELKALVLRKGTRDNDMHHFKLDLTDMSLFAHDLDLLLRGCSGWSDKTFANWTLNLVRNPIGYNGARILQRHSLSKGFLKLSLWQTGLGSAGAEALAQLLRETRTLKTLKLCGNEINDEGSIAIAKALKTNSTVYKIGMGQNKISDLGSAALADAFLTNSRITTVGLSFNDISGNGAAALAQALEVNSTLTDLNLRGNRIGTGGMEPFVNALENNKSLRSLNLRSNGIPEHYRNILLKSKPATLKVLRF